MFWLPPASQANPGTRPRVYSDSVHLTPLGRTPPAHPRPPPTDVLLQQEVNRRGSTFTKKLLAVAALVKKFQHSIQGRKVIVYTDHKPLTNSMNKSNSSSTWPLRAERHLLFISQFTTDIIHVAGEANKVADALSRPPLPPPIPSENDYTNEFVLQEPFTLSPPAPSPSPPPPPSPTSTSRAAATAGCTVDAEEAAGSPTTRPYFPVLAMSGGSLTLPTTYPPTRRGSTWWVAMQAAQMTDTEGAQLSKLKGFSFSYVMFKEVSLLCDIKTTRSARRLSPACVPKSSQGVHPLSSLQDPCSLSTLH